MAGAVVVAVLVIIVGRTVDPYGATSRLNALGEEEEAEVSAAGKRILLVAGLVAPEGGGGYVAELEGFWMCVGVGDGWQ